MTAVTAGQTLYGAYIDDDNVVSFSTHVITEVKSTGSFTFVRAPRQTTGLAVRAFRSWHKVSEIGHLYFVTKEEALADLRDMLARDVVQAEIKLTRVKVQLDVIDSRIASGVL